MRRSTLSLLITTAVCSSLFCGCEWTASDENSSWSGSYDNLNFAATYRTGVAISATGAVAPTTTTSEPQVQIVSKTANLGVAGDSGGAGKLEGELVAGSVSFEIVNFAKYSDDGQGHLIGDTPLAGSGTIAYDSGAWAITTIGKPTGKQIVARYSYNVFTPGSTDTTTPDGVDPRAPSQVKSITVLQTGQNLTFRMSNGYVFTGKFTSVNEIQSGYGATYNAQFQVMGVNGKIVGSFDSTSGQRILDASWTYGRNTYDIHGTGGAVPPSRSDLVE